MRKRVIDVLAGTLLALIATTVWVPLQIQVLPHWASDPSVREAVAAGMEPPEGNRMSEWTPITGDLVDWWGWRWERSGPRPEGGELYDHRKWMHLDDPKWRIGIVHWLVFASQALILLIGGGLLTWLIRLGRRRSPAAA